MKFLLVSLLLLAQQSCEAFSPHSLTRGDASSRLTSGTARMGTSEELGIPCEDDCAITKFPNLPESVHPGVLSGQAMMDLLNHARDNGT